jgi:hypothetical protein
MAIPIATPVDISSMQKTYDSVNSTIDDYFKANPISKWVSNYQSARDLDYIQAEINKVESEIRTLKQSASDLNTNILAFKNQNASEILNIHKINKQGQEFYMIFGNGGCLQSEIEMNPNRSQSATDVKRTSLSVGRCDANNLSQRFSVDIFPRTNASAKYPGAYHLRPDFNKSMCLEFSQSGLSVQPCDDTFNKKGQNFAPINNYVRF